jgi:hypothetical protein
VVAIILEPSSPHYKRWRDLMLLMLCCYALDDHVLSDVADQSVFWARLNSIMVTWILDTLTPELYEIVWEPTETACQVRLTIEAQFLGNNESRVLQLDARFRAFKQGDLSVSNYCHRMKGMPGDLCALGETITDHHLVLYLLQSMNKRFDHMKIFIKRSQPSPSFHTIRNNLKLKEIELDHLAAWGQAFAFYSMPSRGGPPSQQHLPLRPPQQEPSCTLVAPPPPAPTPNNGGKGKCKGKGKGKGKNNGSGGSSNNNDNNSRGTLVWPSLYNSWTSTNSMWPGMCPLQQQPTRPSQHALLAALAYYGAPSGPSFAPMSAPPPH